MWYDDTVRLFEDYFQFDQLDYLVYRRFLELLRTDNWWHFHSANKKHYKDCITFVGIGVYVDKCSGRRFLMKSHGGVFIYFATAEDYRRLEREHPKFWPYFKFHKLGINFDTRYGKMIDRGPIPVPKVYWRLNARNIKQTTDIDYMVKEAVHPGVEEIVFCFWKMKWDEAMPLINYALSKIQGVSEYCFSFQKDVNIPEERFRQLIKLPPTAREMPLEINYNQMWYRFKNDL